MTTEPNRMPTHEARTRFAAVVEDVAFRGKRVVVTSYGRDRAALVSMEDLAKLIELETGKTKRRSKRPGGAS